MTVEEQSSRLNKVSNSTEAQFDSARRLILKVIFLLFICACTPAVISFVAPVFTWIFATLCGGTLWIIFEYIKSFFDAAGAANYTNRFDFVRHVGLILVPAIFASVAMGFLFFVVNRTTRRDRINFDSRGIGLGKSSNPMLDNLIYWSGLKKVELHQGPWVETSICFTTICQEQYTIKWKNVVDCVDTGLLLNEIKTKAPAASKFLEFPRSENLKQKSINAPTYTKLWFMYHTDNKERKRTVELTDGDVLASKYTIVERVGSGGQGTAYLAADSSGTDILLKEYILPLHRGNQALQETVIKLEREAELLRSIKHPQIVSLHDCFVEDYRGYLVMEFVDGRTLKQVVDEEGPQPETVVRELAMQACEIISYLHAMDPAVIHRDLTPDNFILQDNGLLKLVDFNVAHRLESAATATVVGKHCYIPPEQFRGKATIQSDIYALGGTLHFLLTGLEPEPITVSHPRKVKESVSSRMDEIIAKATALETNKRYSDAAQLAKELAI